MHTFSAKHILATPSSLPAKTLLAVALLAASSWAVAQTPVAGTTTTTGISVTESTQAAAGWSVKKTLMGKTIYNDAGDKVGKVEDLIVSPERNVSYIIVGAGGFIGIGRHDVAVPVAQIHNQSGKLVMSGATKDMIKALPAFDYTDDTGQRDAFVAGINTDLAKARTQLVDLQKKASTASADVKQRMNTDIAAAQVDLKSAEDRLAELQRASSKRWKEFEAGVSAANGRLRKAIDKAMA